MAYTAAQIKTAVLQSLGPSISADTSKVSAIEKAIAMAYVETATIMGADDTSGSIFNLLWFKKALYEGTVVAVGLTDGALHLYKVYHDYLDLIIGDRRADASAAVSEPS